MPPMNSSQSIPLKMSPAEVLARTIWGEARGDGAEGMTAVANVVMNRARDPRWWGRTVSEVCLKKWQFSCWNADDPNRAKLLAVTSDDREFQIASEIAAAAIAGTLTDITNGANSYKFTDLDWPFHWGRPVPAIVVIGHQSFYRFT
jgi:N-acetylmuramoyl-L-alanine amidase